MRPGVPPNLPMIGLPLAPRGFANCLIGKPYRRHTRFRVRRYPNPEQLATIIYTSRHHRYAQGRDAQCTSM